MNKALTEKNANEQDTIDAFTALGGVSCLLTTAGRAADWAATLT